MWAGRRFSCIYPPAHIKDTAERRFREFRNVSAQRCSSYDEMKEGRVNVQRSGRNPGFREERTIVPDRSDKVVRLPSDATLFSGAITNGCVEIGCKDAERCLVPA